MGRRGMLIIAAAALTAAAAATALAAVVSLAELAEKQVRRAAGQIDPELGDDPDLSDDWPEEETAESCAKEEPED